MYIFVWLIGQWVILLNNKTARSLFLSTSIAGRNLKLAVYVWISWNNQPIIGKKKKGKGRKTSLTSARHIIAWPSPLRLSTSVR